MKIADFSKIRPNQAVGPLTPILFAVKAVEPVLATPESESKTPLRGILHTAPNLTQKHAVANQQTIFKKSPSPHLATYSLAKNPPDSPNPALLSREAPLANRP